MRKHSGKSNFRNINSRISPQVQEIRVPSPGTTVPLSTLSKAWRENRTEETFSLSIESHLTIRPKVELSRKRISLLLEQEIVRVVSEGFSLLDYYSFEFMFNYLVGSDSFHNVSGKKLSTVVYCSYLILLQYRDNWNLLYKRTPLRNDLVILLERILGKYSDRKYQGRKPIFQLEKFLEVRIERVDSYILERSQNSVRYSSYCKGYGESGRSTRRQSTRYSYELDRDDHVSEIPEEFYSFGKSIHDQEDLFDLEQQILAEKKA